MSQQYHCDSCDKTLDFRNDTYAKELAISRRYMFWPWYCEFKRVHLCRKCFIGLGKIVEKKEVSRKGKR